MASQNTTQSSRQGREELDFSGVDPMMGGYAMDRGSNISTISASSMCTDETYDSHPPTTPNYSWEERSSINNEYATCSYDVPMAYSLSSNSQNHYEKDPRYVPSSQWVTSPSTTLATGPWSPTTTFFPQYPQTLDIQPLSYTEPLPVETTKPTPKSLGWTLVAETLKLYRFVVPKGKEPYFELLPNLQVTAQNPERVYLDEPRQAVKGSHPCRYPLTCNGKQNNFTRPADLERHYKNVHCPQESRDRFPCDYPRCVRNSDAFTRKDHYRDHLRDFHKEDIVGSGKGGEKREKAKGEWERKQRNWWEERRVSREWWRCARCLVRVYVNASGWVCGGPDGCKGECESERRELRERMERGKGKAAKAEEVETGWSQEQRYFEACKSCEGRAWIEVEGEWALCATCQRPPLTSGEMYTSRFPEESSWGGSAAWSSYK